MVLQKHWNNAATGDTANLSIAGGTPDPATATSTVTTTTGSTFTDTTNQAAAAVRTGDQVTVTEDLPAANTGSYDTTLACDNGAQPDADGTFTVTAAMVATGVTCTFSNTRQTATVVLQKHWNNAATGDTANLSIAGGTPDPATAHLHGDHRDRVDVHRHHQPGRRRGPHRGPGHRHRGPAGSQHRQLRHHPDL